MKILLVITKAEIGGAQSFVLSLAKGLKRQGKEVMVACGEDGYLIEELDKVGVKSYKLKGLKRSKNLFKIFSYIYELKKVLNKEEIDVLHLNSSNALSGVISAKLISRKIKTVFTVHGLSLLDKNYRMSFFSRFLYRLYYRFFCSFISNIVFVSEQNRQEAIKQKLIKSGELIYNGLDFKEDYFLSRDEARLEISRRINQGLSDVYLIASVGRLAYAKNYTFLVDNWNKIKGIKNNAKLVIIGEGDKRKELEIKILENRLEKDVYLLGEIKNASKLLKAFDLFILPSLYEGLSISLIESQFAEIPALASDVGGSSEVIGKDNCFKLNNSDDMTEKISQDVKFNDRSRKFRSEEMIKKYLSLYEI